MNAVLNLALGAVLVVAVVGGLRRGLRRELLNVAGLAAAFVGGILLAKPVAALVSRWGVVEEVPYLLAFVLGFVLVSLTFSLLKKPLLPREIDTAERISGGILGLAKGLLFAALLLYALIGVWPRLAETTDHAVVVRMVLPVTAAVDALAGAVAPLLPEELTAQLRSGYRFFREAGEQIGGVLDTVEGVGETAREYGERVREGAAVVDSLAGMMVPPP